MLFPLPRAPVRAIAAISAVLLLLAGCSSDDELAASDGATEYIDMEPASEAARTLADAVERTSQSSVRSGSERTGGDGEVIFRTETVVDTSGNWRSLFTAGNPEDPGDQGVVSREGDYIGC